jgi:hypothetical protein
MPLAAIAEREQVTWITRMSADVGEGRHAAGRRSPHVGRDRTEQWGISASANRPAAVVQPDRASYPGRISRHGVIRPQAAGEFRGPEMTPGRSLEPRPVARTSPRSAPPGSIQPCTPCAYRWRNAGSRHLGIRDRRNLLPVPFDDAASLPANRSQRPGVDAGERSPHHVVRIVGVLLDVLPERASERLAARRVNSPSTDSAAAGSRRRSACRSACRT